jgi:hypothetical protein
MTITIANGTIKFPAGKEFPSQKPNSPNRVNIVVTLNDGGEAMIWGNVGGELNRYRRGQAVQLIFDGKIYKLVESATEAPASTAVAATPTYQTQTPESAESAWDARLAIVSVRYGKALEAAIALAQSHLGLTDDEIDDPANRAVIQPMAASLFIESNRR